MRRERLRSLGVAVPRGEGGDHHRDFAEEGELFGGGVSEAEEERRSALSCSSCPVLPARSATRSATRRAVLPTSPPLAATALRPHDTSCETAAAPAAAPAAATAVARAGGALLLAAGAVDGGEEEEGAGGGRAAATRGLDEGMGEAECASQARRVRACFPSGRPRRGGVGRRRVGGGDGVEQPAERRREQSAAEAHPSGDRQPGVAERGQWVEEGPSCGLPAATTAGLLSTASPSSAA